MNDLTQIWTFSPPPPSPLQDERSENLILVTVVSIDLILVAGHRGPVGLFVKKINSEDRGIETHSQLLFLVDDLSILLYIWHYIGPIT